MWIVGSDNPDGAGNQQERLSIDDQRFWFLAGLVEGEGSVHLAIKRHPTAPSGYLFQPEFFIYQHKARRALLEMAEAFFDAGRIRPKPGNPDVLVYSVISRKPLREKVAPFLERCMLFSSRCGDYSRFISAVHLLDDGFHKTPEGAASIVELAYSMNMNGKQRHISQDRILDRILRGHMPDTSA